MPDVSLESAAAGWRALAFVVALAAPALIAIVGDVLLRRGYRRRPARRRRPGGDVIARPPASRPGERSGRAERPG